VSVVGPWGASRSRRSRTAGAVVLLTLLTLLTACSQPDPLAGLGGPGLASRCAAGLPAPRGTVERQCNDGQGRGIFAISLEAGTYDLVVLCDGPDDVSLVLDPTAPLFDTAVARCGTTTDPVVVRIGTLDTLTGTQLAVSQHGEGDSAYFIVRR